MKSDVSTASAELFAGAKNGMPLHISDRVRHSGLGEGIVIRIEVKSLFANEFEIGVLLDNANTFRCPSTDLELLTEATETVPLEINGGLPARGPMKMLPAPEVITGRVVKRAARGSRKTTGVRAVARELAAQAAAATRKGRKAK